jgi:hypothetical protein
MIIAAYLVSLATPLNVIYPTVSAPANRSDVIHHVDGVYNLQMSGIMLSSIEEYVADVALGMSPILNDSTEVVALAATKRRAL